jgi:hypothetical protein
LQESSSFSRACVFTEHFRIADDLIFADMPLFVTPALSALFVGDEDDFEPMAPLPRGS